MGGRLASEFNSRIGRSHPSLARRPVYGGAHHTAMLRAAGLLRLARPAAAAVVAHPGEGVALDGKPPDRCLINAVYLSAADGKR